MRYIALVFILFFSLNTTAEHSHKTPKNHVLKNQVFLEIFLNNKGKIVKNNQEISYNKLKTALKKLKEKNGIIRLAIAKTNKTSVLKQHNQVLKLISSYQLVVRPYTDQSFTKELIW